MVLDRGGSPGQGGPEGTVGVGGCGEVSGEHGVAGADRAHDAVDGRRAVPRSGCVDQECAVGSEAGQHGLRPAGPQFLGGVDDVADGGDGSAGGVGQFVGVRLDQVGSGGQGLDQGRSGGVDHDLGAGAVAGLDELGVVVVGEPAGQAAAAGQPGARLRSGSSRVEECVALRIGQSGPQFVDLRDDAVGLDEADVDADLAGDGHGLVAQPGLVQHLHEVRAGRAADGEHGEGGPVVGSAGRGRR